jgi:hypothetical protein
MANEIRTFWSIGDTGKLSPEILDVYNFLNDRGFCKRTIDDEIELYRKRDYFVEQSFQSDQINEISNYLLHDFPDTAKRLIDFPRKGPQLFEFDSNEILEKFVKFGWTKIFSQANWNHLPELNVNFKKHTRENAYFYFKNGYVDISAKGVKLLPYSTFHGKYIYKDYLVPREIKIIDIDDPIEQDFARRGVKFWDFLSRTAGIVDDNPTAEAKSKMIYLLKLMGFLLHDYKQQGLTDFCVILCDDNTGGSGKGIIIQALKQLTTACVIDCRKNVGIFDPNDLTERTRIKVYNDVSQNFNFGEIYNEITDGGTIRHFQGAPRPVAYKDSWKTMLTSNYIIRGNNGPDLRRQRVFSMFPFFNQDNLVQEYYKHSFFSDDWNENDWNYFYNVMFTCVKLWLNSDYKVNYADKEYQDRKLEASYPAEFREYVDGLERGTWLNRSEVYYKLKEHDKYKITPFVRKLTQHYFSTMLTKYLEEMKITYKINPNRTMIFIHT